MASYNQINKQLSYSAITEEDTTYCEDPEGISQNEHGFAQQQFESKTGDSFRVCKTEQDDIGCFSAQNFGQKEKEDFDYQIIKLQPAFGGQMMKLQPAFSESKKSSKAQFKIRGRRSLTSAQKQNTQDTNNNKKDIKQGDVKILLRSRNQSTQGTNINKTPLIYSQGNYKIVQKGATICKDIGLLKIENGVKLSTGQYHNTLENEINQQNQQNDQIISKIQNLYCRGIGSAGHAKQRTQNVRMQIKQKNLNSNNNINNTSNNNNQNGGSGSNLNFKVKGSNLIYSNLNNNHINIGIRKNIHNLQKQNLANVQKQNNNIQLQQQQINIMGTNLSQSNINQNNNNKLNANNIFSDNISQALNNSRNQQEKYSKFLQYLQIKNNKVGGNKSNHQRTKSVKIIRKSAKVV